MLAPPGTHGYDVSWPQCSGSDARNMPPGSPAYVILGLTDVADHSVNPCLGSQVGWAKGHGVRVGAYLVASYPSNAQLASAGAGLFGNCGARIRCRLRNDGAQQAHDAVATMIHAGVPAPRVWIDVELRRIDPWSHNTHRNAAVLQGIVRGLRVAHVAGGVYTTAYQWGRIAGTYHLDLPNWLPSGDPVPAHAQALCRATATGGLTWLVQYTRELDSDLTCPALTAGADGAAGDSRQRTLGLRLARIARPL